jgi:two-component system, LytTR family, response regulator
MKIPPIRVIIVDDEPLSRESLLALLADDPETELVGECDSGPRAVEAIRSIRPDLVFLDVQMPGCDGFDVLDQLGVAAPKAVIFVTAYDQYALKAFEAAAIDYLLKPFDDARFIKALERAKTIVRDGKQPQTRLIVKSAGRVTILKPNEIDWIEAADYYACLHVREKSHLLRRSLADLDEELAAGMFCRIHRSAIVNLERVSEVRLDVNGEHEVVLHGGTKLRLSQSYRAKLLARLKTLQA